MKNWIIFSFYPVFEVFQEYLKKSLVDLMKLSGNVSHGTREGFCGFGGDPEVVPRFFRYLLTSVES